MRMENFTQNLSQQMRRCKMFGFLLMAMLLSNNAIAQCPLVCNNNVQVSMDDDCRVIITPDMMLEGQGVDPSCTYTVSVLEDDNNAITNSPEVDMQYIGRKLKVRVNLGQNSCWGYINVEDKLPPTIECPSDTLLECYDTTSFKLPLAFDNCTTATVTELSDDINDTSCDGDTTAIRTIRYIAEDESGNKSKVCERIIYYVKVDLADVVFPNDTVFQCDNNPNDNLNPEWDKNGDGYPQPEESGSPTTPNGQPIFPNNAICELNATFTDQELPICAASFKVLRQWVVMDWCTSTILREFQVIKIVDEKGPIMSCPPDNQEVQADPYLCSGTWIVPDPIDIFDCSETTYTVGYLLADETGGAPADGVYIDDNVKTITSNQGDFIRYEIPGLPVGRTWVRYLVTDECGNVSSCFTEVDVFDMVPPVAVCDQFTVVTLTNNDMTQGIASIFAKSFDDGSHDNCNDVILDARRMTSGCAQSTSRYSERVNFCCADVGREIMVELRVREDIEDLNEALENFCMVNVTVQNKSETEITCPRTITIECPLDYRDLDNTGGNATAVDNCDNISISHEDSGELDKCGVGTIRRRFTATAGGEVRATCTQTIRIVDNTPFNPNSVNWNGVQDITLEDECMGIDTDPDVTGRPTWNDQSCGSIAASYKDRTFTLVDSVCIKILRTWTVIDWCEFDPNNPQKGGLSVRTQVIKLLNTKAPEFTDDCSDKTAPGYGPGCDGFITLTNDAIHDCPNNTDLEISYRIDEDGDGTFGPRRFGKDASGTYPVGKHKIIWEVSDMCGNSNTCEYYFTIEDKKKPTPYCLSEITTVVMPSSKMIDIWAKDFDRGSYDNCDGENVFISFSSNTSNTKEVFTCDNLGINMLEMWVTDQSGNSDFCTVRVNIQSNDGTCDGSRIAGYITTEENDKVDNVAISLESMSSHETVVITTETEGSFEFGGMATGTEYEIGATRDDDYMNGVSTLDLVLIQRHILGIDKIDSPYKVIAADVNNNEKVSASDLVDLRKLILGIYTELPNNDSWRFVDAGYTIPEPKNPWPFNEVIDLMFDGHDMMDNNFKAVKIGDVNGTAKANLRSNASENRSAGTLEITTKDATFTAGEVIRVQLTASELSEIFGFQFGLQFNTNSLEFVGIEAKGIAMTEENIGLELLTDGIITTSWNEVNTVKIPAEQVLFDVVFKAKKEGTLNGQISVAEEGISSEAYDANLQVMDVELSIRNEIEVVSGVELFQNTPNPFDNTTTVKFNIPNDGFATFKIVDVTGRLVFQSTEKYSKGLNVITLLASDINASGVLYYMIEVDGVTSTRKMILIKE